MLDKRTIFEIHRLNNEGLSQRRIARELRTTKKTVKKYLENPEQVVTRRVPRPSKLDPFRDLIDQLLEKDPMVNAPVVLQRIKDGGFDGEITILRNYLRKKRGQLKKRQAFIRFESPPGHQMQIDWGHFGSLTYGQTKRKLYALAVTESYSRMLYVYFTHSQKQPCLHQGLIKAFVFFGGTPMHVLVDNMLTAVVERQGSLIRFNDAFLDFLMPFKIVPRACNIRAPYEKGKVERSIQYIRQNFWPLRSFKDVSDVQTQVEQWLNKVANVRIHQTTGQRPTERFNKVRLNSLPGFLPDCRETLTLLVHKDFAVRFDGNAYTTPPWTIGKKLILKADQETITIYHRQKIITSHPRCFERKHRIESPSHQEQVRKIQKKLWLDRDVAVFASLGTVARQYLQALAGTRQPIKKNISRLLTLKDQYGSGSLIYALIKALDHKAYGADYIQNILYQEMTPQKNHPPVKLKDEALNRIRLSEPSLVDYDAFILKRRRKND